MNDFKGRHFGGEIVLWAVRWYCRYAVSYRDLESMMTERGVAVDHSTIYRWVQRYAPETFSPNRSAGCSNADRQDPLGEDGSAIRLGWRPDDTIVLTR